MHSTWTPLRFLVHGHPLYATWAAGAGICSSSVPLPRLVIPYQIELLELGNTKPCCGVYLVSSQLQDLQAEQMVVTQAQHCLDFIF